MERNGQLVVRVTAAPTDGEANAAVMKLMAKYLKVPISHITILRGMLTREKVLEIK